MNANVPEPVVTDFGYLAYVSASYVHDNVNKDPALLEGGFQANIEIAQGLLTYLNLGMPRWASRFSIGDENILDLTRRFIQQIQETAPFQYHRVSPNLPNNTGLMSAEEGMAGFMGGKSRRARRKSTGRRNKRKVTRRR